MLKDLILTEQKDGLLVVTINRPEKANALTQEMLLILADIFSAAKTDPLLKAMIITGAGSKVFCAGADLSELGTDPDEMKRWALMSHHLRAIPCLTIAAINGACMGGGHTLVLGCDIRLGMSHTRFAYPVLKNKVTPLRDDVDRMRFLTGYGRASIIFLGGETVNAEEALAWGLLDRIIDEHQSTLLDTAKTIAKTALESDLGHQHILKAMIQDNSRAIHFDQA